MQCLHFPGFMLCTILDKYSIVSLTGTCFLVASLILSGEFEIFVNFSAYCDWTIFRITLACEFTTLDCSLDKSLPTIDVAYRRIKIYHRKGLGFTRFTIWSLARICSYWSVDRVCLVGHHSSPGMPLSSPMSFFE